MANLPEVTEENFEQEVLHSPTPVVVDFMATWCPPCRILAPILTRVAQQYEGQVKFVQLDTDKYEALSAQYGVRKVPNLSFFKNGHVMDQAIGYISETEVIEKVQALLKDS